MEMLAESTKVVSFRNMLSFSRLYILQVLNPRFLFLCQKTASSLLAIRRVIKLKQIIISGWFVQVSNVVSPVWFRLLKFWVYFKLVR